MPSRKPAKVIEPQDVPLQEATEQEIAAAQELPAGEPVILEAPVDEVVAEGPPAGVESAHPVCCKYAGDPSDENCKDCDGWCPVGQVTETGACVVYEPGPPPADWQAFYAEQAAETAAPREPEIKAPSLRESVEAAVYMGDAQTVTIQAEIGITEQIKTRDGTDAWIKANFSEVRRVPENADLPAEREALWAAVQDEVRWRLDQLINQY